MLQQPAIRTARLLGLRKGGIGSRYTQLYISFAISCLYHEFQIFNVTRRDVGEYAFFMSQPLAIVAEDCIQWIWIKCSGQFQNNVRDRLGTMIGYIWVFLWFSYSLPTYIKGIRDANIISDALLDTYPFDIGSSLGLALLSSLKK